MDDEQRYFVGHANLPRNSVPNYLRRYFVGVMEDMALFSDTLIVAKNLYHDEALALKKLMNAGVSNE